MTESAAHKAWVRAHPERVATTQRRWREKNPGYHSAYGKEWRRQHPDRVTSGTTRRQRKIKAIKQKLLTQHQLRLVGLSVGSSRNRSGDSWARPHDDACDLAEADG